MIIRKLVQADLSRGFRETLRNLRSVGRLSLRQMEAIFQKIEQDPNHFIFVAIENDEVVGSITIWIEQKFIRKGGRVGHIEDVAVRKGWEGRSIGRMLVKRAEREAQRRGCYKKILDCSAKKAVFYRKLGFREHEIEMRKDIKKKKQKPRA